MSTAVGLPLLLRNHLRHFEDSVIRGGVGWSAGLLTSLFRLLSRWTSSDLYLPSVEQVDK